VEMLSVRIQGPATQNVGCCGGQAVEGNCGGLRSGDARQSAVGNRGGLRSGEE